MDRHDVVVVGGGPAGMQTAIFLASEGLKTLVIEKHKIGGQIGQTPRLENFLGMPGPGITGVALANHMRDQVLALGAKILSADAIQLCSLHGCNAVQTSKGIIPTRAVVLAVGASWRHLPIDGLGEAMFVGLAKYGPHASLVAHKHADHVGLVVGGGNSAAQGILELAGKSRHVHVVAKTDVKCSEYLLDRIKAAGNITIHREDQISSVACNKNTAKVKLNSGGEFEAHTLLLCPDSTPNTNWLVGTVNLDEKGYVLTGNDISAALGKASLETNLRGVFAVGDCRRSEVRKSVARAVGDGSDVANQVHNYLRDSAKPASSAS